MLHAPLISSDPLLQPFTLKGLRLRNRIISTAHALTLDEGGMPTDRYRAYQLQKARGGIAMTMIGGSAMVSRDSSWGGGQLNLATDSVIPHLHRLTGDIHAEGALVMAQISHLGRRAQWATGNWMPALAPSRVREARNRSFPREMDRSDINRIVADYAAAAKRCVEGGLDGIETLTGGHLIGQFLSPLTNHRSDAFGGSLKNRARFGLMVHEAIRNAVGDDVAVGIRFAVAEGVEGGLTPEDGIKIAQLFESEGVVDFFNCIYGMMDTDLALSQDNMPGMFQTSAPYLSAVAGFRREVTLPLIHAGGIRDTATARHTIREGLVDLVGMTRAHLADPELVLKVQQGHEDRIRPCVGASYCLLRKSHCIHNAATTRELTLGHDVPAAAEPGRVVVVGGGPAGLEAARVAAMRGHDVVLFEAGPQLGGQLRLATRVKERANLVGILDWREAELTRLGVDMRLNIFAEAADVLAEAPRAVIVATGGLPDLEWLDGWQHCVSVWDVLSDRAVAAQDVLIYDGTGRQPAASCALGLLRQGKSVTFATPDDAVATEMTYQDRSGFRKKFAEYGVVRLTDAKLVKVARQGDRLEATFRDTYCGTETRHLTDLVVVEHGTLPLDNVFRDLAALAANGGVTEVDALLRPASPAAPLGSPDGFVLHRIGDAAASRDIHAAILDGYRVARLI